MGSREPLFQEYYALPGVEAGAVWRYSREHRKPAHFHAHLELLLVTRGHAVERIGKDVYSVHAGQLLWHLPAVAHELLFASSDLDMRVIHIEPDVANDVCRDRRAGPSTLPRNRREVTHDNAGTTAFSQWVRDIGWLATGRPVVELARSDVHRLLEDCDSPFDESPPGGAARQRLSRLLHNAWEASVANREHRRASSIIELACCLLLEDPTLDRPNVCRLLEVSEGYLSRCFQKELGTSFVAQRARIRISRFVTHVACDQQNLLEAALSAGFAGYTQMHRTFSEVVGMSPTAYLRRGGRQRRAALTR